MGTITGHPKMASLDCFINNKKFPLYIKTSSVAKFQTIQKLEVITITGPVFYWLKNKMTAKAILLV
jgi:hypothetical protein